MSITIRYSKDKDDAQWLLNQAFMKVFSNLGKFDTQKQFKPWLRRIIINTVLSANEKVKDKHISIDDIEYSNEEEEDIISKLNYQQIIDQIQQLTPSYRSVLNLYIVEGFKHHEIAEKLGISEGASKSNLFKAKQMLKKRLKNKLDIER